MAEDHSTVRRVIAPRYGDPDVLQVVEDVLPAPGRHQVSIEVRAVGVNPMDYKIISGMRGRDESQLPLSLGNEVAGVITALGEDAGIATGGGAVGDEVLAYRVPASYASMVTVPAADVFAKPSTLDFPQAANLLLVGVTAADMLRVAAAPSGSTVLVHGASGAVGASLLQQARLQGLHVIGTSSERHAEEVRRFGAEPVTYGEGLEQRVRELAPDGVAAAFDCVGTDEAVDVSLALTSSAQQVVSIAAFGRAATGIQLLDGTGDSRGYRDGCRARLIDLAAAGDLVVPIAATYPLDQAAAALEQLRDGHPGGKIALLP